MMKDGRVSLDVMERAKNIEIILMDVDGVMTGAKIVYDSNGLEIKHFNAHDGLGIKLARVAGLKTGIISARESGTIRVRAKEIGMDYLFLGRDKKLAAFKTLQEELKLNSQSFCFIGDDLPDIPVIREVGLGVAVHNATDLTKQHAVYITRRDGGDGAVREVIELILDAQGKLESAVQKIWE